MAVSTHTYTVHGVGIVESPLAGASLVFANPRITVFVDSR
jgi:hypothetical protein